MVAIKFFLILITVWLIICICYHLYYNRKKEAIIEERKIILSRIVETKLISREGYYKPKGFERLNACIKQGNEEIKNRNKLRKRGKWLFCKIGFHIPKTTQFGTVCLRCQQRLQLLEAKSLERNHV